MNIILTESNQGYDVIQFETTRFGKPVTLGFPIELTEPERQQFHEYLDHHKPVIVRGYYNSPGNPNMRYGQVVLKWEGARP